MDVALNINEIDSNKAFETTLECICDNGKCPVASVEWFHENSKLENDFLNFMITDDKLSFMSILDEELHGKYECKVDGKSSRPAIVAPGCKFQHILKKHSWEMNFQKKN